MDKHIVPRVLAQSIVVNVSTNQNLKTPEIWHRLNMQFGNEIPSRSQLCKWHKLFKMALKKVKQGDSVCNKAQKLKLLQLSKNYKY